MVPLFWMGLTHSRFQGDDIDLDDEDLPLLEDRKPWLSKFFDCFEISPLDTKDGSPSIKKIIADWDDIKSNKHHVSSEVSTWMACCTD